MDMIATGRAGPRDASWQEGRGRKAERGDRPRGCHPRSLIVYARGLTFIDSCGLKALLQARAAAIDAGVTFGVSEPSLALRRIVEMTGIDLLEDE
jgi:anti-anti-sigma regulatory factor